MEDLYPWSSLATVERVLEQYGEESLREWLAVHWTPEFLSGDPAAVNRLLPYIDLTRCGCRAATVLYAVDHDWVWVLDEADVPACGFLPPFWRDAFARAQEAGSSRCIAWLLDAKGSIVSSAHDSGLEL